MEYFEFRPRFSPTVNGRPCRFSIGAYRGKKRVIIAWFADQYAAYDYLARCRRDNSRVKFDCLQSLF